MGRTNKVETHPERARIERMLDDGHTYDAIIRTVGRISKSSLSRFSLSRKSELARAVDQEPGVTDVLSRLVQVAEHARDVRQRSKLSGSPVSQTRAIKSESEILSKLLAELGVDDMRIADYMTEAQAMAMGIRVFVRTYPESSQDLIAIFEKTSETTQLAEALRRAGTDAR